MNELDPSNMSGLEVVTSVAAALPNVVKKSWWKALTRLIGPAFEWPSAWFASKAQRKRDETAADSLILSTAAQAVAAEFGKDEKLLARAKSHFADRIFREQTNREAVVMATAESLKSGPPIQNIDQEIDDDWLDVFSRVAEMKSNQDMQQFMGKLLAGEIRKPGSFSLATIQALSVLSTDTARSFQALASISARFLESNNPSPLVHTDPFGDPGLNELSPVGFSYERLAQLQDDGLLQQSLHSFLEVPRDIFLTPIEIGGKTLSFVGEVRGGSAKIKLNILCFTRVGVELHQVIHREPNEVYLERFIQWAHGMFGISPATDSEPIEKHAPAQSQSENAP